MQELKSTTPASIHLDTIHKTVEAIFQTYQDTPQEKDMVQLFEEKLAFFVERSLRDIETRRASKVLIEQCVQTLHQQCAEKYLYNSQQNAFYEIQDAPVSLQLISSDNILIALREQLPATLEPHRLQILKMVRSRLQHRNVFEWSPSTMVIQRMTKEWHRNFNTLQETEFFMKLIGAMVHHREETVYTDEQNSNIIHLWFGDRIEEVIECVQRLLYNGTHSLSPFWNKVKRRMHHTYSFQNIHFIHFPSIPHKNPFRIIKHSPMLFLASCSHMFRTDPTFIQHSQVVRRLNHVSTPQQLFSYYLHENMVLTNKEQTTCKQQYLLLREILNDFSDYLGQQSLPADTMTKQDIIQSVHSQIQSETYGTRGTKHLYYATFRIGAGDTLHELFLSFCSAMLIADDSQNSDEVCTSTSPLQLHNNYRMWCKHYVATNDTVDCDLCLSGNSQNRHWYCSYKLFIVLLQKKYGLEEQSCRVRVQPSTDIWKLYLEKHTNDNIADGLAVWVKREFGICMDTPLSLQQLQHTHTGSLANADIQDIHNHIESYIDVNTL